MLLKICILYYFTNIALVYGHDIPRVNDRLRGSLIGDTFKLGEYIGGGGFGLIYGGLNIYSGLEVAIKLELRNITRPRLRREATVYHRCNGTLGFPKFYWFGDFDVYSVLVIDKLGQNLVSMMKPIPRKLKFTKLRPLIPQMIERLEFLHKNRFLHHDVSPGNFVMGRGHLADVVHIIDFGSAMYHRPGSTSLFKADRSRHVKTVAYCSVNAMQGYDYTPVDDLIAVGYSLVGLTIGLPWGHVKDHHETLRLKLETPLEELCGEDDPSILVPCLQFFSHLQRAEEESQPVDYDLLKAIFLSKSSQRSGGIWRWIGV